MVFYLHLSLRSSVVLKELFAFVVFATFQSSRDGGVGLIFLIISIVITISIILTIII